MDRGVQSSSPNSYKIKHDKVELELAIVDIDRLRLHEDIIPEEVESLKRSIIEDGMVRDPVIVDNQSFVVLDGVHRVEALRSIGCLRVPCCLIDYDNNAIGVGCWYREILGEGAEEGLRFILKELKLPYSEVQVNVESVVGEHSLSLVTRGGLILRMQMDNLRELFRALKLIEESIRERGFTILYRAEVDALNDLREGRAEIVLATPAVMKDEVRKLGLQGETLPHKVTRHIIPARPLGVNVPLGILMDKEITLDEANRYLQLSLQSRKVTKMQPGSVIIGRRYEEEVLKFSD